jgi:hypothetical protein
MQDVHVKLNPVLSLQKNIQHEEDSFHRQMGLIFKEETMCDILRTELYGVENWTLRKVGQKYLGSSETWCWRRMEKISLADRVRNEEILRRVKEERNIIHTVKRRKAN